MTSKSPDQTLLEAHNLNRWAAKNPDQLLFYKADIIFVKIECIMVSHVVEVELRLSAFLSEHNFCKIDVISAKT